MTGGPTERVTRSHPEGAVRDFVGYGRRPPRAPWPGDARIAISLVLNYEEGSEQAIPDGDPKSEPLGEAPRDQLPGRRDLAMESMFEYGSRAGVWRLLDIFDEAGVPATLIATAVAIERNPDLAAYLRHATHEICSHGYRWEDVSSLGEAVERDHIARAVASLTATTGRRPLGWYCRYGPSEHTRRLVVQEGGFEYDSDSYADDLPSFVTVEGRPWCVVPYTLDANDMKFWRGPGVGTSREFFEYLKDTFDCLYREGATTPKMMSVGLHCRIAGRPGRSVAVREFIEYARARPDVWFARRIEIARAWTRAFA